MIFFDRSKLGLVLLITCEVLFFILLSTDWKKADNNIETFNVVNKVYAKFIPLPLKLPPIKLKRGNCHLFSLYAFYVIYERLLGDTHMY